MGQSNSYTQKHHSHTVPQRSVSSLNNASADQSLSLSSSSLSPHNYCIAIRGNGELMEAHWGALAQTVENFGVPKGMAGGSSGSISTFFMESILMNPYLKNISDESNAKAMKLKAASLAFLLKSIEGFVTFHTDQKRYQDFFAAIKIIANVDGKSDSTLTRFIKYIQENPNPLDVLKMINNFSDLLIKIKKSGVFYGPQMERLYNATTPLLHLNTALAAITNNSISDFDKDFQKKIDVFKVEYNKVKNALAVFGSFNAKDDKTLFLREGVINFNELAKIFGFIANFYSLRNASETTKAHFSRLLKDCAKPTIGMSWDDIELKNVSCKNQFNLALGSYSDDESRLPQPSQRLNDSVGAYFPSLISTSVVVGDTAVQQLKAAKKEYEQKSSEEIENKDYLNSLEQLPLHNENLKFGYWGQSKDLQKIQNFIRTKSTDPRYSAMIQMDKTKRWLPLGEASWSEVLSLSPAEPGLAPLQTFTTTDKKELISLGGWSDLLPIPVLKFMGCQNVVYVTRQGGESLFAQGVAKRIFSFPEIEWKDLDPEKSTPNNKTLLHNNLGRLKNQSEDSVYKGLWSKMFNLANPESSFNISLSAADAIICTNWNSYDIKKDFRAMINESYQAPIYNPSNLELIGLKSNPKLILKEDNILSPDVVEGFQVPRYAGCIPNPTSY